MLHPYFPRASPASQLDGPEHAKTNSSVLAAQQTYINIFNILWTHVLNSVVIGHHSSGHRKCEGGRDIFLKVSMSVIMMVTRFSLSDQAKLTKEITAQVKLLSDDENEVATDSDSPNQPYDQAKALWRTAIDMDRIAAGLPCGSESFLLMFARWKKLERDFYNGRKKYVSQL
jgi:hypothetical protein